MKTLTIFTRRFVTALAILALAAALPWSMFVSADDAATADQARDKSAAAEETTDPALDPVGILRDARERLVGYRSVKAHLVETVRLGRRRFTVSGLYLQGTDLRLRLELRVKTGELEGSLLEVSNGQVLFTRMQLGEETRLTRRDLEKILEAASADGTRPEYLIRAELGLGGLPALLASLEESMTFNKARVTQLAVGENTPPEPMIVVEGSWNEKMRKVLTPRRSGQDAPESGSEENDASVSEPLPDYVPDAVRIAFRKSDLFPRRIIYLKKNRGSDSLRPMVQLDFVNVRLNEPVDESAFQFQPADGVTAQDVTNLYLRRLGAAASSQSGTPDSGRGADFE